MAQSAMHPFRSPLTRALACPLAAILLLGSAAAFAEPPRALSRFLPSKREWTVHAEVRLFSGRTLATDAFGARPTPTFRLNSAEVVYPLIHDTASSDAQEFRYKGELWVENRIVDKEHRVLDNYQGLSSIAVWDASDVRGRSVTLKVNIASVCYETRIDEKIARAYTWPTHPWNAELALCLEPQFAVEVNDPEIAALVKTWTQGRPRSAPPYDLAKRLAGETLKHFRRTQGILESANRRTGLTQSGQNAAAINAFLSGYRVNGAAYAARTRQGSPYDLACLLTAVYRAAGLPARMVIGFDIEESEKSDFPVLRAWVEFFLAHDPAQPEGVDDPVPVSPSDGEWIPVDITRQQEFATRAPPITQRWQYFGHNEELDMVPPFAFHWLPPSSLTNAGAAAVWGWLPQPANPVADQEVRFWALSTPKRGDDPDIRRR